jgi:hypothetical protein
MPRQKSQRLYLIAALFVAFSSSISMAQNCSAPDSSYLSPLVGEVNDPPQGLKFAWSSTAYRRPENMYWTFYNLLCNAGQKSLIVSWPKAGLYASAFSPLAPFDSLSNSYPGGIFEPVADEDSPIKTGYRGRVYTGSTYQKKLSKFDIPRVMLVQGASISVPIHLFSELSLKYTRSNGGVRSAAVEISADKTQNGYSLSILQRTSDSVPLLVGLSMDKENRRIFNELFPLDDRTRLTTLREFLPPCTPFSGLPCSDEILADLGSNEFVFLPPDISRNVEVKGGPFF